MEQLVQSLRSSCCVILPVFRLLVPAGHSIQVDAPVTATNCPAAQTLQFPLLIEEDWPLCKQKGEEMNTCKFNDVITDFAFNYLQIYQQHTERI